MLTRFQAADPVKFAEECEIAFLVDHQGDVQYAISLVIDDQRHGAAFVVPGEGKYSEDRVAQGIAQLFTGLVDDGFIGHKALVHRSAVTLTGNPIGDLTQVAAAIHGIPTTVH